MKKNKKVLVPAVAVLAGLGIFVYSVSLPAQNQAAPKFKLDPDWPKPLPNKWKMGGVTGLAVAPDGTIQIPILGVVSVQGTGRIARPGAVAVTGPDGSVRELVAKRILVATGSVPIELPGLPFDGRRMIFGGFSAVVDIKGE